MRSILHKNLLGVSWKIHVLPTHGSAPVHGQHEALCTVVPSEALIQIKQVPTCASKVSLDAYPQKRWHCPDRRRSSPRGDEPIRGKRMGDASRDTTSNNRGAPRLYLNNFWGEKLSGNGVNGSRGPTISSSVSLSSCVQQTIDKSAFDSLRGSSDKTYGRVSESLCCWSMNQVA